MSVIHTHVSVQFDQDGDEAGWPWKRSAFPHPLVTCDFNQNDELTSIDLLGSVVIPGMQTILQWLSEPERKDETLVERLAALNSGA